MRNKFNIGDTVYKLSENLDPSEIEFNIGEFKINKIELESDWIYYSLQNNDLEYDICYSHEKYLFETKQDLVNHYTTILEEQLA